MLNPSSKNERLTSKVRIARLILTAVLVSLLAACSLPSSGALQVKAGQPFKLSPGESAKTANGELAIAFNSVVSDSRCPSDAKCIQAGEAIVSLTLQSPQGSQDVELSTADDNSQAVYGGYQVKLISLEPYPISIKPIAPETYVVMLVILQP